MHLSRQLGAFVKAGLPLIEAVRILGEEAKNRTVRTAMLQIEEGLRGGERLSDCLDRHPKVFPEYYRGILRSAELTGQLDVVLDQLAKYLERDLEARRKVSAALIYPAVIAAMSLVTVVVLAAFVLPRVQAVLRQPGREAAAADPDPARHHRLLHAMVVGGRRPASRRLSLIDRPHRCGPRPAGTCATACSCACRSSATRSGPRWWSGSAGSSPRWPAPACRCPRRCGSPPSRCATGSSSAPCRVGDAMLGARAWPGRCRARRLFPSTAARMIRVGEETGTLDAQLDVTAHYYEGELDHKLEEADRALRAGGHHRDGRRGRLRGDRDGVGDVRHLQPGQRLTWPDRPEGTIVGRPWSS